MVRLIGIEPTHPAPEAGALSTELQAPITLKLFYNKHSIKSIAFSLFSEIIALFSGFVDNPRGTWYFIII